MDQLFSTIDQHDKANYAAMIADQIKPFSGGLNGNSSLTAKCPG